MFRRHNGMGISAGPPYTEATMGQATSGVERDSIRQQPSCSIVREDSIKIEEEPNSDYSPSRPDSFSIHCDRTDQAPYVLSDDADNMMTSTSLLGLPRNNDSARLAFFLKTTGPIAPHRRPSKAERPKPGVATRKKALHFFKLRSKQSKKTFVGAHQMSDGEPMLRDEGGLLMTGVEQRQTSSGIVSRFVPLQDHDADSTGRRYLHVIPKPLEDDNADEGALPLGDLAEEKENEAPALSPDIYESTVDISMIEDDIRASLAYDDNWFSTIGSNYSRNIDGYTPPRKSSADLPLGKDTTVRVVEYSSPVRPRASNPPTPQPESAVSMAESYRSDLPDHPAKRSFDACRALSSHPVNVEPELTALPKIPLPKEEFPVKLPSALREVEIKHPSPRRFASHPVLLQRASSIASSLYPRSFSDSPGPPPPRSPLRLRRDARTIENIIATHETTHTRKATPKLAPTIEPVAEYSADFEEALAAMKPTVITDCTGPIKRQRSRNKSGTSHPAYPSSRKEREERIRSRKLRDRPYTARTIDAVVNATPPPSLTRRLRKPRPQIQIPELKPAPLVTRASSSASSNASWKKITECTRTPVSPVPSQDSPASRGEKTGYTPVSPTASTGSNTAESCMALSPVMLVAEEIPVPKTKSTPKPAKLVLRDGKSYAPRPRSASIPRNALLRRSRTGSHTPATQQTPSRSVSPLGPVQKEGTPPLPSPPPNRALPPTPPASGSEKPAKVRLSAPLQGHGLLDDSVANEAKKRLPIPPIYEILPKRAETVPHVASQRKSISPKDPAKAASKLMDARLEALEKQNAMLSAALVAVLRTNGAINGPLSALAAEPESPMRLSAWETRIARRSAASQAASHAASSSNGSALEMYMSTRRGSKHGCGGA
ncbi:hypothetical protein LTR15_009832 [Elasticomyces elasticus]|nr:hypothetical protein LTR15_009832 [Elasticomyces elasticus]